MRASPRPLADTPVMSAHFVVGGEGDGGEAMYALLCVKLCKREDPTRAVGVGTESVNLWVRHLRISSRPAVLYLQ